MYLEEKHTYYLHLGIVVVILIIMAKNKRILLELIVEDFGIVIRAAFFIIYYTQVDVCIQFYMLMYIMN